MRKLAFTYALILKLCACCYIWARAAIRSAWLLCSRRRAGRCSTGEARDGIVSAVAPWCIGSIAVGMSRAVMRIGGAVAMWLSNGWLARDCRSAPGHDASCAAHVQGCRGRSCDGWSSCPDVSRVIAGECFCPWHSGARRAKFKEMAWSRDALSGQYAMMPACGRCCRLCPSPLCGPAVIDENARACPGISLLVCFMPGWRQQRRQPDCQVFRVQWQSMVVE